MVNAQISELLAPDDRAKSMASFNVSLYISMDQFGPQSIMYSSTVSTFHVDLSLKLRGRTLYMPLNSLMTAGWLPISNVSIGSK